MRTQVVHNHFARLLWSGNSDARTWLSSLLLLQPPFSVTIRRWGSAGVPHCSAASCCGKEKASKIGRLIVEQNIHMNCLYNMTKMFICILTRRNANGNNFVKIVSSSFHECFVNFSSESKSILFRLFAVYASTLSMNMICQYVPSITTCQAPKRREIVLIICAHSPGFLQKLPGSSL